MGTNRDQALASESQLRAVAPKDRLFGVFGMLRVDEGFQAVITLDGRFQEIVSPGGQFLGRYNPLRQMKVYYIDTRDRQLTVEANNELAILHPAMMRLERLSVVVGYRVIDARKVAVDFEHPLGELFDWVMTAMRSAVAQLQYEDFLTGGRAGPIIVNDLRSRGLDTYLGIQVLNAQIAQISGQGRIDAVNLDQYAGVRETEIAIQRETMARSAAREQDLQDAINDRDIAKVTELTPALVAQRYPELFRPIVGDRAARDLAVTQMLAELAKMGTIDVRPLLEQMGMPGAAAAPRSLGNSWQRDAGGDQSFASLPPGMGARSASSPWPSALPVSDRIAEEAQRIEQMLGVAPRVVQDGHGYILHLVMSDPTDHASLEIILACPVGYPAAPPQATVVMGGREEHFQNDILRYWTSDHSLAEVVDAIVRFYG